MSWDANRPASGLTGSGIAGVSLIAVGVSLIATTAGVSLTATATGVSLTATAAGVSLIATAAGVSLTTAAGAPVGWGASVMTLPNAALADVVRAVSRRPARRINSRLISMAAPRSNAGAGVPLRP